MEIPKILKAIFNINVIVSLFISAIMLLISHKYTEGYPFWHDFTHEVGFAFLVSVIIWVSFEAFTSAQAEIEWKDRIDNIIKHVFYGVLRRKLPDEYMQEVNKLAIESSFIRSNLKITYTLFDDSYEDRTGVTKSFVRVETKASYKMNNISASAINLPMNIGLPNPLIDEMKGRCKVSSVIVIRGGTRENIDCAEAERKFKEEIKDDSKHTIPFRLKDVTIDPDDPVEIIFNYTYAKEEEDNELYQTLYPADGIELEIFDRGPTKRIILAKSIGPHDLENLSDTVSEDAYYFKLSRYLLPRQGAVVWWKKFPAASSPMPSSQAKVPSEAAEPPEAEAP